jgi:hypothetical protein
MTTFSICVEFPVIMAATGTFLAGRRAYQVGKRKGNGGGERQGGFA